MTVPGDIKVDIADGIATLRLANPARRNAISTVMWKKLAAFADDVAGRRDVRVVLIRGDGDEMFSAGADISDFATARSGEGNARAYDDLAEDTCRRIEAISQPTIAMICGGCFGAGSSVAASCDPRVATEDAFFAVPAAKLGLNYDPRGIARLTRVFGPGAARHILYGGSLAGSARARSWCRARHCAEERGPRPRDRTRATHIGKCPAHRESREAGYSRVYRRSGSPNRGRSSLCECGRQRRLRRRPPRLRGKAATAFYGQLIC
jgi:enoyl-CoA hydratase/carnithine racemase